MRCCPRYFLATTTIEADSVSVEDVFKRINATGRQLSAQELRQAGTVSQFNNMVQQLASKLRGDYTKENIILLEDMQKYSLSSGELHYGIDVRKVFWTKQGIINYDALRRSKDEEIIAHICNNILSNYESGISKKKLDSLYNEASDTFKNNEQYLTSENQFFIISQILSVFDDINKILCCANTTFKALITSVERSHNVDIAFILIFLAVYKLKNDGFYFSNYDNTVVKYFRGIADEELDDLINESDAKLNYDNRNKWIERLVNRIKKCMNLRKTNPSADKELYKLLEQAVAEEQMYDFKMSISTIENNSFNSKMITKCVQTLIAMANTKPCNVGYVILGIADDEKSAKKFEKHYNKKVRKINNLFVTGIQAEATHYYHSVDGYLERIKNTISTLENKVSSNVIYDILTNIHIMPYGDDSLVVMSLKTTKDPLFYDNKIFVRYQSSNKELKQGSPEFIEFMSSFYSNIHNQTRAYLKTKSCTKEKEVIK